jgi:Na+-driven multidrug efflux pump
MQLKIRCLFLFFFFFASFLCYVASLSGNKKTPLKINIILIIWNILVKDF